MYFKRIDIRGFKSFAEPVSIDFHEGITCIVGPNGSGKSNISDAIRWVLGEQSAKMLRGGRMEEVIFAGTENHKQRGMAEVTLTIDNSKKILPIDYSEVGITRRMYRSGESGYYINQVPCRLKDIRELIMDTGIGVDGYSIIGQGKIADILSDKPEARREIFEEAAGIVKYRSKKEESERKLEVSKSNLERVDDIIGEIETRIDGLEEDSKKAQEYLELREKNKEIEINITLKNIESVELKNEYLKDDMSIIHVSMEELEDKKIDIDEELAANDDKGKKLEAESDAARDRLLTLIKDVNDLTNNNKLNAERSSSLEKDRERIEDEIASFELRIEREGENVSSVTDSLKQTVADYELLQADFQTKSSEVESLEKSVSGIQDEIDKSKNNIYESMSLIAGKKSEVRSLTDLKSTLTKRKEQLLSEEEDHSLSMDDLKNRLKETEESCSDGRTSIGKLKSEIDSLKKDYIDYQAKAKALGQELERNRISKGKLSARLNLIKEMEVSYEGYNEAVKFIMKSNLENIHGVVAELIQVPQGFEKAIETALGAALQNIVCEKDRDASNAIELLKKRKAGRLTFLPIEGIKAYGNRNADGFKNSEGFKGLGVDCIKFDNRYKSVMQYLLGRVVIVDKLNDAIRMSKQSMAGGFRFVSLEGDVVNASGAITGGSFRNNTSGLLERKSEVRALTEELKNLIAEQKLLMEKSEELSALVKGNEERIDRLNKEQRESEIDLLNKENELSIMRSRLHDIESMSSKRKRELGTIDSEEKAAEKMIDELSRLIAEKEELIISSELKASDALNEKKIKTEHLEREKENLTKIRLSAVTAENERNNAKQALARLEENIKEHGEEIAKRKDALSNLRKEKDGIQASSTNILAMLSEKEKEKIFTENKLQYIAKEKALTADYLGEIRKKKEELTKEIEELQRKKHELELKLAKNETLIEGYKEKLWEDFEVSYVQAMDFPKKAFVMSAAVKENREIKNRMKELGEVNIGAIKEYENVKERYDFLTGQRADLTEAMDSLNQIIDDMDRSIKKNFKESFDQVVLNFESAFTAMFGGGVAELRLTDETKPLETGIDIIVQPPGKKLQNINLLSGGEKTLTAIALMFAILKTKPTPFCILDEVEAALDESNIDRFAGYLKGFKETQFALVTHQKATMEYADVLYGITMPEGGISKVISLRMEDEIAL